MARSIAPDEAGMGFAERAALAGAALAALALLLAPAAGWSQPAPQLTNPKVVVDYYEPRNQEFLPLYEKLQKRQVLEELAQFLAPVRWPKKVRLMMKECPYAGTPKPEVFYAPLEYSLTVCYQLFPFLGTFTPPASFATRQEVIVGGLIGAVLNAAGHATFDMLKVPRLGADEDAADQAAGFVALQFGPEVARTVVKGTYYLWDTYEYYTRANNLPFNFAGSASTAPQRKYNVLCIAYGHDKALFQDFVNKGLLPAKRAETCAREYDQVKHAFAETVLPSVDMTMMKQIQTTQWLQPDDLK